MPQENKKRRKRQMWVKPSTVDPCHLKATISATSFQFIQQCTPSDYSCFQHFPSGFALNSCNFSLNDLSSQMIKSFRGVTKPQLLFSLNSILDVSSVSSSASVFNALIIWRLKHFRLNLTIIGRVFFGYFPDLSCAGSASNEGALPPKF